MDKENPPYGYSLETVARDIVIMPNDSQEIIEMKRNNKIFAEYESGDELKIFRKALRRQLCFSDLLILCASGVAQSAIEFDLLQEEDIRGALNSHASMSLIHLNSELERLEHTPKNNEHYAEPDVLRTQINTLRGFRNKLMERVTPRTVMGRIR